MAEQDYSFDMDEARRARAEARGEPPKPFKFGDVSYDVPPELPYSFSEAIAENNWRGAIASILNGQADEFFQTNPSINDLEEFARGISAIYAPGSEPGESPASRSRSSATGKSSRQRSKASTT